MLSPDDERSAIATRILQARERTGWTQLQARDRLGLGTSDMVGRWERGDALPQAEHLATLCKVYGVSADWVLGVPDPANLVNMRQIADASVDLLRELEQQAKQRRELIETALNRLRLGAKEAVAEGG